MSLPLTPAILEAGYEFLRATPPFRSWKLPHGEEVEFHVTRHRDREGDHCTYRYRPDHVVRVSAHFISATSPLLAVLAHEMIHVRQAMKKTARPGVHNAEFKRIAKTICKLHGFDERTFL